MLAPPIKLLEGGAWPPPPSSYAYDAHLQYAFNSCAKFQNECLKTLRRVDHTILLHVPLTRDVPLTPYFHLTDGNLTKDTYNVLRRL